MQPRGTFRHPWGGFSQQGKQGNGCDGLTRNGMVGRLTDAPTLPATITDDARKVDPREVARWCLVKGWMIGGHGGRFGGEVIVSPGGGKHIPVTPEGYARRLEDLPTLPATITDDARKVDPPQLPAGTVAYMDPPYQNTTGYAHDLGRDAVVELARKWSSAGALVCISEAEPIHALVADGWKVVEITGERKGQKRTFSKQQREYLTISRDPAWRPSVQGQLFA